MSWMNQSESLPPPPILAKRRRRRLFALGLGLTLFLFSLLLGLGHNQRLFAQEISPTPTPTPLSADDTLGIEVPTPSLRVTNSITETFRAIATATAQAVQTMTAQATPGTATPTASPTPTPGLDDLFTQEINRIIGGMSVADRVGQLFVIDFQGNQTTANSDIAELIQEYRIGGVVISPENRNFSNVSGGDTPVQVAILTNQLQALAYGVYLRSDQALNPPAALLREPETLNLGIFQRASQSIPLFIGVEQMGDDLANTSLRQGFTTLPSQMALGAT